MKRGWPYLSLEVGLDLMGMVASALLAAGWQQHSPALALQADGLPLGLGFFMVAWFLGGYS